MKPLATAQVVLTWIGILSGDESTSWWKERASVIFTFFAFVSLVCGFAAGVTFIVKFISIDLESSLFGISVSLAYFSVIYVILVALLLRSQIPEIFQELSEIHAASESYRNC